MRDILDETNELTDMFINFIVFQNAFDSINRETVWKNLCYYGMLDKQVRILEMLYVAFSASV